MRLHSAGLVDNATSSYYGARAMTEKKGFLGSITSLFVEEVPEAARAPARNTPLPAAPNGQPAVSTLRPSWTPDPDALQKLENRLRSTTPPEYAAFVEQYENLKDVIPDDSTRFKAALKTSHTTADKVLGAIDVMLATMEQARVDFTHSFEEGKSKRVAEAEQAIHASDELIKSSEEQIKAIQDKIESVRQKRTTDQQNLQNEVSRLEGVRGGFEAALSQVVGQLNTVKNRLAAMPKV
jgi:hypothetical protein